MKLTNFGIPKHMLILNCLICWISDTLSSIGCATEHLMIHSEAQVHISICCYADVLMHI